MGSEHTPNLQRLMELNQTLDQPDYEWYMRERVLAEVVNQAPYGMIACDRAGNFIIWNERATELIGRGSPNFNIENWSKICKVKWASDRQTVFTAADCPLARALRGEFLPSTYVWVGDKEHGRLLRCSAKPVSDLTSAIGAVMVFFDNAIPAGDPADGPKRANPAG